ncbi:hypothetical protein EV359DRAFT_59510 [Lentinula novae-zelandiae]|nr:hypothetical protein EV359DRAFT_59510 [Lentinula novae-zelandiae]
MSTNLIPTLGTTYKLKTLRIYCRAVSLNLYQRHRGFEPIMNNTYYDDHGNTIYTVHTPFSLSPHRTTTISKAIHDTASGGGSREASTFASARRITIADEPMGRPLIDTNSFLFLLLLQCRAEELSTTTSSTSLKSTGRYSEVPRSGSNFGRTHPQLVLNDASKMLVATFHQERLFSKNNTAHLEIFPPGQHMIDEIFVTFTYIERLRRAKERSAKN